jgi:hypothetical protein
MQWDNAVLSSVWWGLFPAHSISEHLAEVTMDVIIQPDAFLRCVCRRVGDVMCTKGHMHGNEE